MKCFIILLALFTQLPTYAQEGLFDSLLRKNTHYLHYEGKNLAGNGLNFILQKTRNAQFVNICEEHSAYELPGLTSSLFEVLQKNYDFRYLALEQDPLRLKKLSEQGRSKGNLDSSMAILKRYPSSFTFRSDQDVAMLTNVASVSKATHDPLWGCDPASGISHYLRELLPLAPTDKAKKAVSFLLQESALFEDSAKGKIHYISQKIDAEKDSLIHSLNDLFQAKKGSYAEWLIQALQKSVEMFQMYAGNKKYTPYEYGFSHHNMVIREGWMKSRFLQEYRSAMQKDKQLPKVLSSFGHYHLMKGFGPSPGNQMTLGTFLNDLATFNQMECFTITTVLTDSVGSPLYNSLMNHSIYSRFMKHVPKEGWNIIDLVPFRYYLNRLVAKGEIKEEEKQSFQTFLIRYDALLFIKNGKGTYQWKEEIK